MHPAMQVSTINSPAFVGFEVFTLVLRSRIFYPEDGGDTILRNIGSIDHIYTAPHPRRRHFSALLLFAFQKFT
jgi:hypothetical protein